ncbi:MAG: 50S ribosomal protein L4 [Chloroflexi bacterium]|nr:50S ribosomal protein L4 [Chloroflexota bacterium]
MPQASVYNMAGEIVDKVELAEDIFGVEIKPAVMHQALTRQQANARQGTADTKRRGEVAGGGAKPWRQKGTGRARQGSTRSPLWKGGGVVFGPHPRKYTQAMPRQARRLALKSALTAKAVEQRLIVVDELRVSAPKTKEMVAILEQLAIPSSALILLAERDDDLEKAARNLPLVKTLPVQALNLADLLKYDYLVVPKSALAAIEETFGE